LPDPIPAKIPEKELLKRVRRLHIRSRRMVNEVMAGEYQSAFRGRGIEFDQVREYQEGDEERMIDWNVTARFGIPYVKSYIEERELTVHFLVDISASGRFGCRRQFKHEVAAEFCAVLAFSAIRKNDRVGPIPSSDQPELYVPAKTGQTHLLRTIRELLFIEPRHLGTSLDTALTFCNRVNRRRAVIFLVSDFLDDGYLKNLRLTNQRHDVVAVEIIDPMEKEIPTLGLIELEDPETGIRAMVDTSDPRWRREFQRQRAHFDDARRHAFRQAGIDQLTIYTDRPFEQDLVRFFKKRSLRA